MTGKQHLIAGTGLGLLTYKCLPYLRDSIILLADKADVIGFDNFINQHLNVFYFHANSGVIRILSFALFFVGLLLPDIDLSGSTISRLLHFYLPIGHRTWTHTIWILLLLFLCSFLTNSMPLLCLTLGYFYHLFCDSLSVCGVCWFYPISQYRELGYGKKVKNNHFVSFYGSDFVTGYIWAFIIFFIGLFVVFFSKIQQFLLK